MGWDGHNLKTLTDCFVGAIAEKRVSPPTPASTSAGGGSGAAADEHQQRPPEFSISEGAEVYVGDKGGALSPSADGPDAAAAGTATTGTLDLHYSGAGIVGSWEIRRLQSGLSAALVDRWVVVYTAS